MVILYFFSFAFSAMLLLLENSSQGLRLNLRAPISAVASL
jgi:hypothetical protein